MEDDGHFTGTEPEILSPEDLKSNLAAELDKVGDNNEILDVGPLCLILHRWIRNTSSLLPNALLYPVELKTSRDEHDLNFKTEQDKQDEDWSSPGLSPLRAVEGKAHDRSDHPVGLQALNKRGRAVVVLLRNILRNKDLEVFLTQPSAACSAQGEKHSVGVSSHRDYQDVTGRPIFSNFMIPNQDTLVSTHADCNLVRVSHCSLAGCCGTPTEQAQYR